MKALSNSDELKAFITPNMADLIISLDNNGKTAFGTGYNIPGLYRYLEIIGSLTKFTTSVQLHINFGPKSFTNIDTATLLSDITDLFVLHQIFAKNLEELDTRLMPA